MLQRTATRSPHVIVELTNSGMDFYFMKPLKLAKRASSCSSRRLGLAGVQQVMRPSSVTSSGA